MTLRTAIGFALTSLLLACDPFIDLGALDDGNHSFPDPTPPRAGTKPDAGAACPDPSDPKVHYIGNSDTNPGYCLAIFFGCQPGQKQFSDACGCGCIDP